MIESCPGAPQRRPVETLARPGRKCGRWETQLMSDPSPSIDESALAIAKALATRRARQRADPRHARLTAGAIAERVTGMLMPPRRGRDGWWLVGRILDELDDVEFSVWYVPGARRIGLSRRESPACAAPAPPVASPYYYDGLRRKWIDAATGEIVPEPSGARPPAAERESGKRAAT